MKVREEFWKQATFDLRLEDKKNFIKRPGWRSERATCAEVEREPQEESSQTDRSGGFILLLVT